MDGMDDSREEQYQQGEEDTRAPELQQIVPQIPEGIREIELTPEMLKHKSRRAMRYEDLVDALRTAHQRGRGIAVDANRYWKGWEDRSIYMAIRRLGDRYGLRIGCDRSRRESEGVVFLWIQGPIEKGKPEDPSQPPGCGPGRPRKDG